jgi:putative methanogenesis marker protein 6
MATDRETRMIVISPSSSVTPDQLTRFIHALGLAITVKETCYGAMIEGATEPVRAAVKELRRLDPNKIYSKVRGFPMGDMRRCRAHHGSRPGFTQLEQEWACLPLVQKGLDAADRGEQVRERERPKKLPVSKLKKIVEESK